MNALSRFALVWLLLVVIPMGLFLWAGLAAVGSYWFGIFLVTGVLAAAPAPYCPHCGRKWKGDR